MHGDLRWSLGPSRGISLAMETKPMRDEMKPEGHTCDQEMHDMMGTPLTSWHGHCRALFAIAVLRLPWRRKRLANHLGHGVLMSQEHMK